MDRPVLTLAPLRLKDAKRFVGAHHSHNEVPPAGWLFGVQVTGSDGKRLGVGIAGRPEGRGLDDGTNVGITRVCTTGTPNACSRIYGALCRAARALGYRAAYTYTLESECAACVRAAGFVVDKHLRRRGGWDTNARPRLEVDLFGNRRTPLEAKTRWIRRLA